MVCAAVHLPGTAADFAFRLGLKTAGLDIEDVKTVMVGGSSPGSPPSRYARPRASGIIEERAVERAGSGNVYRR